MTKTIKLLIVTSLLFGSIQLLAKKVDGGTISSIKKSKSYYSQLIELNPTLVSEAQELSDNFNFSIRERTLEKFNENKFAKITSDFNKIKCPNSANKKTQRKFNNYTKQVANLTKRAENYNNRIARVQNAITTYDSKIQTYNNKIETLVLKALDLQEKAKTSNEKRAAKYNAQAEKILNSNIPNIEKTIEKLTNKKSNAQQQIVSLTTKKENTITSISNKKLATLTLIDDNYENSLESNKAKLVSI